MVSQLSTDDGARLAASGSPVFTVVTLGADASQLAPAELFTRLPAEVFTRLLAVMDWREWTAVRNASVELRGLVDLHCEPHDVNPLRPLAYFATEGSQLLIPTVLRDWTARANSGNQQEELREGQSRSGCMCLHGRLLKQRGEPLEAQALFKRTLQLPLLKAARKNGTADGRTMLLLGVASFEYGTLLYQQYNRDDQVCAKHLRLAATNGMLPNELRKEAAAQLAFVLADSPHDVMNMEKQRADIMETLEFAASLGCPEAVKELGLRLRQGLY